jgi:hypothetical protein
MTPGGRRLGPGHSHRSGPSLPPVDRRPAPTASPRGLPPRRTDLSDSQVRLVERTCVEVGVPAPPWVAWARSAATAWGPVEAVRRAWRGGPTEPSWAADTAPARRPRRWPWGSVLGR